MIFFRKSVSEDQFQKISIQQDSVSIKRLEPIGAGGQPGGMAAGNKSMLPLSVPQRKREVN
jgi:hypothetical protein